MGKVTVSSIIARFLRARDIDRVFGLCGGHIMPIWMDVQSEGIRIIDVRDERAAVHMAQAHAELTGKVGVALVTAGPGVTNAITGIANAHVSRAPVLVLSGTAPRAQENRGALQDLVHTDLVRSITRYARTVREPALVLQELDEAMARTFSPGGEPGPVYLDFPADVLRCEVPTAVQLGEHFLARRKPVLPPERIAVEEAAELLWAARRVLVISGRGARTASPELVQFLDRLGAVYLDTGESRGLVPDDHPSVVAAMRAVAMKEAEVVVTLGRRLDFQLAFGSPAVFGAARFVRIADTPSELRDNRRGAVEVFATPKSVLPEILGVAGNRSPEADRSWASGLRRRHDERVQKMRQSIAQAPPGSDGLMHPNRLLAALQDRLDRDAIFIADGGDILSFARVGLSPSQYLDPGSLGCIGIGVPFGIAASLAFPERTVAVITGDGAFGFNAIELDTAVRHDARLLVVIANNGAWQIEVRDQEERYGKVVGTRLRFADYAQMARGLGMYGERVEKAEDLPAAIERALARRPALLDVLVTPEAVSADSRSGLALVPDLQALTAWDEAERQWRLGES